MDLNALKLLVQIIDAGSLSAAARDLNTTKSNISYKLKSFEETLGVQLLRRTTRQLKATQVGEQLYEHGRNILREMAAAQAVVSSAKDAMHGRVSLSVSPGLGHEILAPLLIKFQKAHPAIMIDVAFNNKVENLIIEKVDIALRITSAPPENAIAVKLADVEWLACAHPAYLRGKARPERLNDLRELDIVCSSAVGRRLRITGQMKGALERIEPDPVVQSEDFLFLKRAVMGGLGVGFLPSYLVQGELSSGKLLRLLEQYKFRLFGGKIYMVTLPNRYRTAASRTVIQFLKKELAAVLAEKSAFLAVDQRQ